MLINLQPKAMTVSTDGSENAKDAFYQCFEFLTSDYHLFVLHISDAKKLYLPYEFKTTYIWEDYKNECLSRISSKRYDLLFQEFNPDFDDIRTQILSLSESISSSYLFFGYSGRKGKKQDPSLLGQTVRKSLHYSKIPLVIVKKLYKRSEKPSGGFIFLSLLDGSDKSLKALDACLSLSSSADRCIALTATSLQGDQNVETIRVKFREIEGRNKGKKMEFRSLEPSNDPCRSIIDFVNLNEEIDVDFVVLGNNGIRAQIEGKSFLGMMAENVLARVKANPIIIP